MTDVSGDRHDRVAGALPDAADARRGIALEDGAVLGIGNLLRSVLRRLPVGVVRTPFHVINLLAIEFERNPQLDQRLDLALPRKDALAGFRNRLEVASADGGKADTTWPVHVDHAPPREVALERARRLLFDISPRRIGNWGELAVKIIHIAPLLGGSLLQATRRAPQDLEAQARALTQDRVLPPQARRRSRIPRMSRMARRTGFRSPPG